MNPKGICSKVMKSFLTNVTNMMFYNEEFAKLQLDKPSPRYLKVIVKSYR